MNKKIPFPAYNEERDESDIDRLLENYHELVYRKKIILLTNNRSPCRPNSDGEIYKDFS